MTCISSLPKSGLLPDSHAVPDVLEKGMVVVFCGTALGRQSALHRAYYANPGNFFWRALHEAGFTPHRFKPTEYTEMRTLRLGLTDLCKTAFGNDNELPVDAFDRIALEQKIRNYQPDILAFTSKAGASEFLQKPTAALAYGLQSQTIGVTRIYILPSPSGHARRFWRPEIWQELATQYHFLAAQAPV